MKFTLLTHFKEFEKRSNTGRVVLDVLGSDAEQLRWDRMNPPMELLEEIENGGVAVVYPGASDGNLAGITRFIVIDGTWHEARKIYQRSPYLMKARRVGLTPTASSRYNLRKNQKEACLCTAECVIEILRGIGDDASAERLEEGFLAFISQSGAKQVITKRQGVHLAQRTSQ
ncbi:MAG: tRNA-uridine aminocarboxypropyltransferase [Deltaproteobacteria bacterium]